jgi:CPA1 family monovalent cation:H+ antiporter
VLSWVLRRSNDLVAANGLVLVAPFLLYVSAEEVNGSGILAVVIAALVIAHSQHADPGHSGRVQSATVWRHITFVLQALAFFLVGLEIPDVLSRLGPAEITDVLILVPAVVVALIVTRSVFVLVMVGAQRAAGDARSGRAILRAAAIIAWAGARGPVSGLAAFSIPLAFASGERVPFRDVILATTFCVIVITLLLSLALGPLTRALGVESDDDEATLRRVDVMLARAALERLSDVEAEGERNGRPVPPEVSERLREETERRIIVAAHPESVTMTQEIEVKQMLSTARAMVRAEQEELLRLRDEDGLPDAIVRPLLRALDTRGQALKTRKA